MRLGVGVLGAVVFATMVLAAQARTVFGDLRRLELEREIAREHLAGEAALYFEVRIDGRPVDPVQWRRRK